MIGIPRVDTGAVVPPEKWASDVIAYHDNTYDYTDPAFPTIHQPHVVLVKGKNPVARAWQLDQQSIHAGYLLQPSDSTLMITCDDALLDCIRGIMPAVVQELCQRLKELVARGLVKTPEVSRSNGADIRAADDDEDDIDANSVVELIRANIHTVSRECFYSKDNTVRLNCINPAEHIPTDEQRLEAYRKIAEKNAVAIPVSYWNRHCDAE